MAAQEKERSAQQLAKRSVVSSLLFKFPETGEGKPVVALFRRSDRVSTYRHHLAPISGSISRSDPNPLSAAWREINEETTLTPSSLSLFRQGKPFTFSDQSVGREWTVHPFAFRLKTKAEGGKGEEGIETDWEHEGWEWYDPSAVVDNEQFGGVPRLRDSLRRVWFEADMGERAGGMLATGLERLRNDHESGARELGAIALSIFRNVVSEIREDVDPGGWWERVRMAGWHIWKNGRESMGAAIVNVIISALASIEPIVFDSNANPVLKRDPILATIDNLIEKRKSTTDAVSDAFASYLRTNFLSGQDSSTIRILTLSASSTIKASLLHITSIPDLRNLDLRILESRPLYEGIGLASSLLSQFKSNSSPQLQITIYTDASAALASRDVDLLVLGADRIASSGDVSNKTGSLPAVLSAKHVNPAVKLVVLSELEKVAEPGSTSELVVEDNDPKEVVSGWRSSGTKGEPVKGLDVVEKALKQDLNTNAAFGVRNIYFEWVPAEFVDTYICEEGAWDMPRVKQRSKWVGEEMERLFGPL